MKCNPVFRTYFKYIKKESGMTSFFFIEQTFFHQIILNSSLLLFLPNLKTKANVKYTLHYQNKACQNTLPSFFYMKTYKLLHKNWYIFITIESLSTNSSCVTIVVRICSSLSFLSTISLFSSFTVVFNMPIS